MVAIKQMNAKKTNEPLSYVEIAQSKSLWYRFWKRFFDIVLSVLALIALSPVLLITAALIVREDGFPIIFSQERKGLHGKTFLMYKFRSMCKNAPQMHKDLLKQNEMDGPVFKIRDDPRVTKIGRFIRRTSIDELPQLVNIIKGEMSIVGPRPIVTYEAAHFSDYENQRLLVKPGLTCYWQVSGRNGVSFSEWMEMDLRYIKDAGLWTDFKLICLTFGAILSGGALINSNCCK